MAPLLQRIDALLLNEADPARRAALLARKACYLARVGMFDHAQGLVSDLRRDHPAGSSPRATVWIMVAEGLIHTFRNLSADGLDRIARAEVLAAAMRDRELMAWTAAWLAHWQFERSEFSQMTRSLAAAFTTAATDEHEALARASMVLANAYAACGESERADGWYMACRHHALEAGDEATLDAFLYNRAVFGISWIRAQTCLGSANDALITSMRREIASAQNLQKLVRVRALTNMLVLWEARLLLLQGQFQRAEELLTQVRDDGPFSQASFSTSVVDLERAFCLARLGRTAEAEQAFLEADKETIDHLHEDEQMYAAWLRSHLSQLGTAFDHHDVAEQRLARTREKFAQATSRLKDAIAPLSVYRPPPASVMKTGRTVGSVDGGAS